MDLQTTGLRLYFTISREAERPYCKAQYLVLVIARKGYSMTLV